MKKVYGFSLVFGAYLAILAALTGCRKPPPPAPKAHAATAQAAAPAPPTPAQMAQAAEAMAVAASRTDGFIVIPKGSMTMGQAKEEVAQGEVDDALQHPVTLTRTFEMQATEVTQAEYLKNIGKLPAKQDRDCPDCPVTLVSWFQAVAYCNMLSQQRNLPKCYGLDAQGQVSFAGTACRGYRLPTEAEWEYAARAGSTKPRYADEIDEIAWVDINAGLGDVLAIHSVGRKQPNAWGLYDMLGNAAEWVNDWQGPFTSVAVTDPEGPGGGENRVFRGGCYKMPANEARANFRNGYGPKNQVEFLGFRPVRSL